MLKSTFTVLIVDHDKKQFAVEGPLRDDTEWIEAVIAAQKDGRDLTTFTSESSKKAAAQEYASTYHYDEVKTSDIITKLARRPT